jgi:hypothetical protein
LILHTNLLANLTFYEENGLNNDGTTDNRLHNNGYSVVIHGISHFFAPKIWVGGKKFVSLPTVNKHKTFEKEDSDWEMSGFFVLC